MVVLGFLGTVAASIISTASASYTRVAAQAQQYAALDAALERIDADLRSTNVWDTWWNTGIFRHFGRTEFQLHNGTETRYRLNGTNLEVRTQDANPYATILQNVTQFRCEYLDLGGNWFTDADLPQTSGNPASTRVVWVRAVRVTITTEVHGQSATLSTFVSFQDSRRGQVE
jgi:hypothetical protein